MNFLFRRSALTMSECFFTLLALVDFTKNFFVDFEDDVIAIADNMQNR